VIIATQPGQVESFSSHTAAAKWLGVSQQAVSRAIKQGYIVKGLYRVFNK
jgi:hypothetical protein